MKAEIKTCLAEVKTMGLEAMPEKIHVVEHHKVPTKEATMETIRALKD
jgi:hypothetical protein